jgi:hypothetical protein
MLAFTTGSRAGGPVSDEHCISCPFSAENAARDPAGVTVPYIGHNDVDVHQARAHPQTSDRRATGDEWA